jgi:hypothetical protein
MSEDRGSLFGRTGRLIRCGYRFISGECDRAGSDITQVRVLGVPVALMRGPAAARLFYSDRLQRQGASPKRLQRTLVGVGTVQGLDGERHHRRKAMFLSLLGPDQVEELAAELARQWRYRLPSWEVREHVVLFDETGEMLCAAVCRWAAMPLPDSDIARRTRQMHALIDGPAAVGPRYWRGRAARWAAQRWAAGVLNEVRTGQQPATDGSVLHTVAFHTTPTGPCWTSAPRPPSCSTCFDRWSLLTGSLLSPRSHYSSTRSGGDESLPPKVIFRRLCRRCAVSTRSSPPWSVRPGKSSPGMVNTCPRAAGSCWTCTAPITTPAAGPTRGSSTPTASHTGPTTGTR